MTLPAKIRVNAAFPFPALVKGSGPITVAKANGIWTIGYNATPTPFNSTISFDTLAQFAGATLLPGTTEVFVRAVTGTLPPSSGRDATGLLYKAVSSPTGLFGEIVVSGIIFDPVYSTNPVNIGEFGAIGDASYTETATFGITATANGTTTLAVSNTLFVAVGMNVANVSWHSFAAAAIGSAGVIPVGTTVVSFVPNTSITVSNPIVAASNLSIICWSEVQAGTDSTVAFQAALDFAMQNGYADVKIPTGRYLISDTLNLGWGNSFNELHLIGAKRNSYSGNLPGIVLYFTKTDRPAINISGSRVTSLHGICMVGRNRVFVEFSQQFSAGLFSADPLDWLAPNLNPTGTNSGGIASTAPYAGITQDAYSAAQPTAHYPARTLPAWTGLVSNYSAAFPLGSEILIEDCDIQGFAVQIVSGLVTNIQGDFLKIHRLIISSGVYGISIGNTQSRNVEIRNINYVGFHTLISGTNLGIATGEFVGPLDNIGGGASYQTFDFQNMGFCGPLIINNLYFEGQTKVGNFVAAQAFSSVVVFNGGNFQFANTNNIIPASRITTGGSLYLTLRGVDITGGPRIENLISGGGALNIDGGAWAGATQSNTSAALLQAVNYTGGFLFGDVRFNQVLRDSLTVKNLQASSFAAISGGLGSLVLDDDANFRNSNIGIQTRIQMTQCMKNYTDTFGRRWRMTVTPETTMSVASWGAGPTYVNDQMSFTWPNANQTSADMTQNLAVGDMLFHLPTFTLFVITAVGGLSGGFFPITTIQQNNLRVSVANAFVANLNPTPALTGTIMIIKTGAVIPSVLEYGTFTSGNANVASISDGSGTSHMLNNYANGDLMFGLPTSISGSVPYRQWPIAPGSVLSAVVDGTPGTLTLSHNALASGVFPIFPYELY